MATETAVHGRPPAGWFARTLGKIWMGVAGWKVVGQMPDVPRMVIIAVPHTTNWDLPYMLAAGFQLGIRPAWLGKRELFRWPFGWFMRFLGGIPVDRSKRTNLVQQVTERFKEVEYLYLVIPPSGTRSRAPHWKSGFYHIAAAAGVPIVCSFLDYSRRVAGIGPVFHPSGDLAADMDKIRAFYGPIRGKFPEKETPIRLPEEETPSAATG